MAGVWIILAKTRFPAELIQSSVAHCVQTVAVPFDFPATFLPDLLSHSDRELERLYDRGYPAFWFFALHLALGIDFCMRLSCSTFAPANAFWESDEVSTVVTLTPSAEQRRACRDQGLVAEPIRIRLVRLRLKGGETEVLATSILDEQRLPTRLFGQLYHHR